MIIPAGQTVIILDSTNKPAGEAIVQAYHPETHQYTVLYQYPSGQEPENILLPAQRILLTPTNPEN